MQEFKWACLLKHRWSGWQHENGSWMRFGGIMSTYDFRTCQRCYKIERRRHVLGTPTYWEAKSAKEDEQTEVDRPAGGPRHYRFGG